MAIAFSATVLAALSAPCEKVTTDLVLRRLLESEQGVACRLLEKNLPLDRCRPDNEGPGRRTFLLGQLVNPAPFSEPTIQAVNIALKRAQAVASTSVDSHHLLWGLTRAEGSEVAKALANSLDEQALQQSLATLSDVELEPEVIHSCRRCGLAAPIASAFEEGLCLACQRRARRRAIFMLRALAMAGLLLLAVTAYEGDYLLLNLAVAMVWRSLASMAHEAAHWLVARLLGYDIVGVTLGQGRPLFTRAFRFVVFQLRMFPVGGKVLLQPTTMEGYRWKRTLIYLAGPLSNLLLAAASWPHLNPSLASFHQWAPQTMFWAVNLWVGLGNLVPWIASGVPTDGSALLSTWRDSIPPWKLDLKTRATFALRSLETIDCESVEGNILDYFRQLDPEEALLLLYGCPPEQFERLLEVRGLEEVRPALLGPVAWKRLLKQDLDGAQVLLDEAAATAPRSAVAKAAQAALAILRGQVQQGVEQLSLWVRAPGLGVEAIALEHLALDEYELGHLDKAARWTRLARVFEPGRVVPIHLRWEAGPEVHGS
ncbi:MAG: M50 family metallopeptidase [Candidatus Eremiobacteraeota bacterium]|nr:M50 family metallopeptidase [Candidatus Eremiobacteraeota bacterium]